MERGGPLCGAGGEPGRVLSGAEPASEQGGAAAGGTGGAHSQSVQGEPAQVWSAAHSCRTESPGSAVRQEDRRPTDALAGPGGAAGAHVSPDNDRLAARIR